MSKDEIKKQIEILNKKGAKLTCSLFKEKKSNMYNKNMQLLISIYRKVEKLRKVMLKSA